MCLNIYFLPCSLPIIFCVLFLARLNSCIESMQNIMGETTPESVMINAALQNGFDPNAAADFIMNQMGMSNSDIKLTSV